jgi:putative addiction module component (TIGR02574 family)
MPPAIANFPLEQLTVEERLELLARLWDSLLQPGQPPPMPAWHQAELARRIEWADADPLASIPVEELRRGLTR